MTATYDITTTIGKIRLKIGDKDTDDAFFTDEELTEFYSQEGNIDLAAAAALESWAASYAANPDNEHIGDYSYAQSISKKMLDMATQLREGIALSPVMTWAEPDLLGTTEGDT